MTREERVDSLIAYLKKENPGYDSLQEPYDYEGKRRLLRSLMNVRFPGPAFNGYTELQDELLTEEAQEKGLVKVEELPTAAEEFGIGQVRNADRMSLWRGDITRLQADAIVNAANTELLMGGGVCGAIFNATGAKELQEACDKKSPIKTGDAVITPGFKLPAKFVIHAAGPVYICITGTVV